MTEREGDMHQLPGIREALGKPSKEEISFVLNSEFVKKHIGVFARGHLFLDPSLAPEGTKKVLNNLRLINELFKQRGFVSSRAAACALYVLLVRKYFLTEAENGLNENSPRFFRFYYDFAVGFGAVVGKIGDAANKDHDRMDSHIAENVTDIFGQASTGEEAEKYLRTKADVAKNAELLKEDPTGFLLADHIVANIRQGGDFAKSNVSVEYAVAGAELARDLYRETHRIAAPLYPQN